MPLNILTGTLSYLSWINNPTQYSVYVGFASYYTLMHPWYMLPCTSHTIRFQHTSGGNKKPTLYFIEFILCFTFNLSLMDIGHHYTHGTWLPFKIQFIFSYDLVLYVLRLPYHILLTHLRAIIHYIHISSNVISIRY